MCSKGDGAELTGWLMSSGEVEARAGLGIVNPFPWPPALNLCWGGKDAAGEEQESETGTHDDFTNNVGKRRRRRKRRMKECGLGQRRSTNVVGIEESV